MIRAFQVSVIVLVTLFTLVALTFLFSGLESALIARAGMGGFAFAVSARAFRILIFTLLLISAAIFVLLKRR